MIHDCEDLIRIFNACFAETHQTRLIRGEEEPIYLPMNQTTPYHAIVFAHGFFSSALHECAHWLIAGKKRRQLEDYGYWYVPDGRNIAQQAAFQRVEVKPQALEWILSDAAGYPFQFSIDNLNGEPGDTEIFKENVRIQVGRYREQGLWPRAVKFHAALAAFYQV
jgi:elongation factor P hydroxylase